MNTKRQNERHTLGFKVEIFALSGTTTDLIEQAILHDISGNGACFLSHHPESYFIGQQITLYIHMPGTHKTDACMQGQASIARISNIQTTETGKQQASIGVSMDGLLSFQQCPMDMNTGNDKPENTS